MTTEHHTELLKMAANAVRAYGIDGDDINSDVIDDRVHPDVFGEACLMDVFDGYSAAEISDVIHEGIAVEYWRMVDEANGVDR